MHGPDIVIKCRMCGTDLQRVGLSQSMQSAAPCAGYQMCYQCRKKEGLEPRDLLQETVLHGTTRPVLDCERNQS